MAEESWEETLRQIAREEEASGGKPIVRELHKRIHEALDSLSDTERRVLIDRFGLEDGRSRDVEEVAQAMHQTSQNIETIEREALAKLRHPSRSQRMRDYFGDNPGDESQ